MATRAAGRIHRKIDHCSNKTKSKNHLNGSRLDSYEIKSLFNRESIINGPQSPSQDSYKIYDFVSINNQLKKGLQRSWPAL